MVVLDTDVFTFIQRKEGEVYDRLHARFAAALPGPICVTVISFEEQVRWWLSYIAAAKSSEKRVRGYYQLSLLLDDYCDSTVLDFDARAEDQYQRLRQGKLRVGTMDLRIAAIVLVHDALLVSRNLADFRKVPGLRVEDWTLPDSPENR